MKKKIGIIILLLILGAVGFLARDKSRKEETGKIQAAASFYPLYFFAGEIAQDQASIINLTPEGAEPHEYELSAHDLANIEKSRLLILNGGGLESWGEDVKKNIDPDRTLIVTLGSGLAVESMEEEGEKATDPHIWLSPKLAGRMAEKIAEGFVEIDPANADYYKSNAEDLKTELDKLDNEYKVGLAECAKKSIITSHDAFGYLARDYGLKQVPIAGLSTEEEPSPRRLAEISEFAKRNKIKYIFFESLVSPKLSETIAREVGAETLVLNPIEGLSREEISQGKNYFTEMRQNLYNLQTALECRK